MKLTEKLLAQLNRVFDRGPESVLALRIRYDGTSMRWRVADGRLTTTVSGGTGGPLSIDLRSCSVAELASLVASQPGYSVPFVDTTAIPGLRATVLIDGEGDQSTSNGDHLRAYTSLLWAYMEAQAVELDAARLAIAEAMLQMAASTASEGWVDEHGYFYSVERRNGEADAAYAARMIAEVGQARGTRTALIDGVRRSTGASLVEVTDHDAITVATDGTKSYGLFDVTVYIDATAPLDWEQVDGNTKAVIQSMRDAGTHLRRLKYIRQATLSLGVSSVIKAGAEARLAGVGAFTNLPPTTWVGDFADYATAAGPTTSYPLLFIEWVSCSNFTGFLAAGGSGYYGLSADGDTWTRYQWVGNPGQFLYLYQAASDGQRIGISSGGPPYIATSIAGPYSQVTATVSGGCNRLQVVDGRWYYSSSDGSLCSSPTGLNGSWTKHFTFPLGSTSSVHGVAKLGSRIVATGKNGYMAYSDDNAATWVTYRLPSNLYPGYDIDNNVVMHATAGMVSGSPAILAACGNNNLIVTTDGINWSRLYAFTAAGQYYNNWINTVAGIKYEGGYWVITGTAGAVVFSSNQMGTLQRVLLPNMSTAWSGWLTFGNNRFALLPGNSLPAGEKRIWTSKILDGI